MLEHEPAKCHCGSVSWSLDLSARRYTCCSCHRPLWMPMEAAPKDGTTVLIYGVWQTPISPAVYEIAFAFWDEDLGWWQFDGEEVLEMLYWMRLPDLPKLD